VIPSVRMRRMRVTIRSGTARYRPTLTQGRRRSEAAPLLVGSYRLRSGRRSGASGSWVQLPAAANTPATTVAFVRTGS
jgi:hypothetical protein